MIGFRHLNKNEPDDGFALLPKHVQSGLQANPVSAFLQFPNSDFLMTGGQTKAPILMHLHPVGLKHVTSAKLSSKPNEKKDETTLADRAVPYWCQYPPPRWSGRLVYQQKNADS